MARRLLHQSCCAPWSTDAELLIPPQARDIVIEKQTYGLTPTDLRRFDRRTIKKVTVRGMDTDAWGRQVAFIS